MTDIELNTQNTVWMLVETEYAGQCTGFGSFERLLGVFLTKPCVKVLAPFVGRYLSDDMGEAISQVMGLVNDRILEPRCQVTLELKEIHIGQKLVE